MVVVVVVVIVAPVAMSAQSCAAADALVPLEEAVQLGDGIWKYTALRVTPKASGGGGGSALVARSANAKYHRIVAKPVIAAMAARGLEATPLGGGRCECSHAERKVHLHGYSKGFGGSEGGPPGRGMSDHLEVLALIQRRFPDYAVTQSPEGY